MKLHELRPSFFSLLLITLFFAGCGIGKIADSVNDAVGVIDQGITTIDHDSTKWQATLQEVADKLPKDIQSTIRNEMDQLVARSIARAGVEFRCYADFLGPTRGSRSQKSGSIGTHGVRYDSLSQGEVVNRFD